MPSIDQSIRPAQPAQLAEQAKRPFSVQPPLYPTAVCLHDTSSSSDSLDSPPVTDFGIPDTRDGCVEKIFDLKDRIVVLSERCTRWSSKCGALKEQAQRAETARMKKGIQMMKLGEKDGELEAQNERLVRNAIEMEKKYKEEESKVQQLRLAYDFLQQSHFQERESADEYDAVTQQSFGDFHGLVEAFTENTIGEITADIRRACAHLTYGRERFVQDTTRCFRSIEEWHSSPRKKRYRENLRIDQPINAPEIANTPDRNITGSNSARTPQSETDAALRGTKRGLDSDNDRREKRVKTEGEKEAYNKEQGEEERAQTDRMGSPLIASPNVRARHDTLDPRPMAKRRALKVSS